MILRGRRTLDNQSKLYFWHASGNISIPHYRWYGYFQSTGSQIDLLDCQAVHIVHSFHSMCSIYFTLDQQGLEAHSKF